MPSDFTNEVKDEQPLIPIPENETVMHPRTIGQSARESFTDYSNPRNNEVLVDSALDIQAAINSVSDLGGGIIRLRAGTYYVKSNITLKPNCRLIGENSTNTIIDFNGGSYSVIIPNNDDTITNFVMQEVRVKNSATHGIVMQEGAQNVIFFGVDSVGNVGDGFHIVGITGAVFDVCNAIDNTGHGFYLEDCLRIVFRNGGGTDNNGIAGYYIETGFYITLYDVISQNNTTDGIIFTTGSNRCRVYSSILNNNDRYGFNLTTNTSDINIEGCEIFSNASDGGRIDDNADRNRITSSLIISNGGWGVLINNANCDTNLLAFDDLGSAANTSGTLSDGGTGTVSVNHIT